MLIFVIGLCHTRFFHPFWAQGERGRDRHVSVVHALLHGTARSVNTLLGHAVGDGAFSNTRGLIRPPSRSKVGFRCPRDAPRSRGEVLSKHMVADLLACSIYIYIYIDILETYYHTLYGTGLVQSHLTGPSRIELTGPAGHFYGPDIYILYEVYINAP